MKKRKGFIFTNKKHSQRAIMSAILGTISIIALIAVVTISSKNDGEAPAGFGFTGVLAFAFSAVGLGLGIVTVRNKEYYRLFPVLGTVLNLVVLAGISLILYAGAKL